MNKIAKIFKALGDENRIKILILLLEKRFCAKGISKYLEISESATSQHLKILKDSEIIKGEKMGRYVVYSIVTQNFEQATLVLNTITSETSIEKQIKLQKKLNWKIPDKCDYDCQKINKCCR